MAQALDQLTSLMADRQRSRRTNWRAALQIGHRKRLEIPGLVGYPQIYIFIYMLSPPYDLLQIIRILLQHGNDIEIPSSLSSTQNLMECNRNPIGKEDQT